LDRFSFARDLIKAYGFAVWVAGYWFVGITDLTMTIKTIIKNEKGFC